MIPLAAELMIEFLCECECICTHAHNHLYKVRGTEARLPVGSPIGQAEDGGDLDQG